MNDFTPLPGSISHCLGLQEFESGLGLNLLPASNVDVLRYYLLRFLAAVFVLLHDLLEELVGVSHGGVVLQQVVGEYGHFPLLLG